MSLEHEPYKEAPLTVNSVLESSGIIPRLYREAAAGELIAWRTVGFSDRDIIKNHLKFDESSLEVTGAYLIETDEFSEREKADILVDLIRKCAMVVPIIQEHSDRDKVPPIIAGFMRGYFASLIEMANIIEELGNLNNNSTI